MDKVFLIVKKLFIMIAACIIFALGAFSADGSRWVLNYNVWIVFGGLSIFVGFVYKRIELMYRATQIANLLNAIKENDPVGINKILGQYQDLPKVYRMGLLGQVGRLCPDVFDRLRIK